MILAPCKGIQSRVCAHLVLGVGTTIAPRDESLGALRISPLWRVEALDLLARLDAMAPGRSSRNLDYLIGLSTSSPPPEVAYYAPRNCEALVTLWLRFPFSGARRGPA